MFFKKQISILIAVLVLVSNSGLAFNVHYCGGKIASITSVFSDGEVCSMPVKEVKSCCEKKQKVNKKCCSDKEVNLKNKTEKVVVKTISFDFEPGYFIDNTSFNQIVVNKVDYKHQVFEYYCDANAPPLYQLYCQYTFYA